MGRAIAGRVVIRKRKTRQVMSCPGSKRLTTGVDLAGITIPEVKENGCQTKGIFGMQR
jgi:hypothetical protein